MFFVGKIVAALVLPPGLFFLMAIVVVVVLFVGRQKAASVFAIALAFLIYVFSTCAFTNLLMSPLEDCYPPLTVDPGASAIVVLGGGYNDLSPEYGKLGALSPVAEKRAIYGLELSRKLNLPLIFSGGQGYDSRVEGCEAEAARRLWISLGAPANSISIEDKSLDTKGNAAGVAAIVKGEKLILVTSAFHMPRSMLTFKKAGLMAVPAPTDYRAKRTQLTWADFIPDASRLEIARLALHEYAGILYYRLTL
jgi:uncharacterized SAM-binding protein YcdF (DUF218 family)